MSAVAWNVSVDSAQYADAEWLHARHCPLWYVMWAPGARRFFAFYQGDADLAPLSDPSPQGLDNRIRHAQMVIARTHPASYWRCPVAGCGWTSINRTIHTPCPRPSQP
ncbi:hypothetical protein DFP74_2678 [Nocardiopsis sp. Huas11]|nr:hypothetical protein DFP74_2678 [Nocardiopsis sp. Huas11]